MKQDNDKGTKTSEHHKTAKPKTNHSANTIKQQRYLSHTTKLLEIYNPFNNFNKILILQYTDSSDSNILRNLEISSDESKSENNDKGQAKKTKKRKHINEQDFCQNKAKRQKIIDSYDSDDKSDHKQSQKKKNKKPKITAVQKIFTSKSSSDCQSSNSDIKKKKIKKSAKKKVLSQIYI